MIMTDSFGLRPITARPRSKQCAKHLTRTCGTCAQWVGPLRGAGTCRLYEGPSQGGEKAWHCPDWTRRSAPPPEAPR